jgi:hypothetical protein
MSSNAALSAAKRRRGGSQTSVPTPNISNSPAPQTTTPQSLLLHHDKSLHEIKDFLTLQLKDNIMTMIHEQLDNYEGNNNNNDVSSELGENVTFMGDRLVHIEKQLEELNESFIKLQSFSMDLQGKVEKDKRDMDEKFENMKVEKADVHVGGEEEMTANVDEETQHEADPEAEPEAEPEAGEVTLEVGEGVSDVKDEVVEEVKSKKKGRKKKVPDMVKEIENELNQEG